VLFSGTPFTLVGAAVSPEHLTLAVSFVLDVVSSIDVARLPLENPVSVFHSHMESTLVFVGLRAWLFAPFAMALLSAFDKVAGVRRSILPLISPTTVGLAVLVRPSKLVTVGKNVSALAMLE
jgi:hypothetical protein